MPPNQPPEQRARRNIDSALSVRPRDTEFAWLREHAQDYNSQWVVLDEATLIASGRHPRDLLRRLTPEERARDALFFRVDLN